MKKKKKKEVEKTVKRLKILRVSGPLILDLLRPGKHCYESDENSLPEDCDFERMFISGDNKNLAEINLVISSEKFPEIESGEIIPNYHPSPSFRRIYIELQERKTGKDE